MTRGGCLCGAVRYELAKVPDHMDVCHCSMCRKFSGGIGAGIEVPGDGITWQGEQNIAIYASSEWAERAFCKTCGSSLFYRMPEPGFLSLCAGTLDDPSGIPLTTEIFIDHKPDSYSFAGTTRTMTEAEVLAAFAPPQTGEQP